MADLFDTLPPEHSPLSRIDPRVRIVSGLVFTLPAALVTSLRAAALALALGALVAALARLPLRRVAARLVAVNGFIAFLWLFLPFTTPGEAVWSLGPLAATRQGLLFALLLTLKANAVVLALMACLGTLPPAELGRGLRALGVPDKLCQLFLFTHRYLFVIQLEYRRMLRAAQARGFRPKTNRHTYRTYAYLIGMLLVKSHDRAERVYRAMLCRGFDGRFHTLADFRLRAADIAFAALSLAAAGSVILLNLFRLGWIS